MSGLDNLNEQEEILAIDPLTSLPQNFVTYIRPITLEDEGQAWAVYTEDGVQMAVFSSHEAAYFSARQNNLRPVSVH